MSVWRGTGEERRPLLAPTLCNSKREMLLGEQWRALTEAEKAQYAPTLRNSKREMLLGEQWRALTEAEKAQYRVKEDPQVEPHAQATSLAPWPLSHKMNPSLPAPSANTPPFHAPAPLERAAAHRIFVEYFLRDQQQQQTRGQPLPHQHQLAAEEQQLTLGAETANLDLAEMVEQHVTGKDAMDIAISLGMPYSVDEHQSIMSAESRQLQG